jgi:multiple sugar transport system permease protein
LSDPLFRKSIITTCFFVIGAVPSIIFITILLSALLIKMKDKLRTIFMGIFYLPEVTALITFILSWKLVYDYRYGILNSITRLLGYENINWLSNKYTVIPSLVAMIVYGTLGVPIILYISAMAAIPQTLYDVAKIDGANEWQILWKITVPLIIPTTLYLLITLTIGVFQTFILVYMMTGGGPYYRTMTMSYFMIREAFTNSNFGMASAIGVIFLIIISGLVIMQYKYFSKEVEY